MKFAGRVLVVLALLGAVRLALALAVTAPVLYAEPTVEVLLTP